MLRRSFSISLGGLAVQLLLGAQEPRRFEPRPAATYPARQTAENVTVAVEVYQGRDKIKSAFGKTDLEKLGVLPVLVIIANENDHALQLDRMKIQLITSDRQGVDPLPVEDVLRPERVTRPDFVPRTSPIPGLGRGKRQPAGGEVDERAFVAPVVAARGSAHGFFYFRLGKGPERLAGAKLYLAGIRNARTGRELLYFEIDWNR